MKKQKEPCLILFYKRIVLKGVTYDSAKAYCSSVLTPVIRGSILLDQAIARSNEQYINTYTGEVHSDSLKQSELERSNRRYKKPKLQR